MDPVDKVGGARAELGLDARPFVRGIDQGVSGLRTLETAGNRAGQTVGQAVGQMGTTMLIAGGAIAAGIGHAVKTFVSFEKQMNAVGAVTGTTGERFKELEALALRIGQTTVFSATEAAAAIEELAKAGQSVDSILSGAADGAVALAAAAGEGIPQAAAQMAQTLNIFKLGGDQAVHVADLFAAAASKTNASAEGIAQGLSNAASVFTLLGVPVEEAVGTLAKFNDESIIGAEAGTALKSSILSLLTPTQQQADLMAKYGINLFDVNGQFVGMAALAEQLKVGLGGLTEAQRAETLAILGGSYGIQGLNVLYKSGADVINQYTGMVDDAGTAAEQAAARNQRLSGALEELASAAETAEIKLGAGIAPALETTAKIITSVVNGFGNLPPGLQTIIGYLAVGTAGTLLFVGAGIKLVTSLQGTFRALATVTTWLTGSTAATNAQTAASGRLAGANAAATVSTNRLAGAARGLAGALRLAVTAYGAMVAVEALSTPAEGGPTTASSAGTGIEGFLGGALNSLDKKLTGDTNALGEWLMHDAEETASDEQLMKTVGDLGFKINQSFMGGLLTKTSGSTIEGLGDTTVRDIQELAASMGTSFEEALIFKADSLGVTTDAIQALKAATDAEATAADQAKKDAAAQAEAAKRAADPIYARNQAIAEGIIAAKEQRAEDELATEVQAALNREFVEGTGLLLPYTRAEKDAEEATRDFNETLQDQVDAVAQSSKGLEDMSADLPGMQQGFGKAGDSLFALALAADELGQIDLSAADREAFRLADNLSKTEAGIDRVSGAIANNQADLSMWEGRIQLVDSVLGSNRDTLAEWERELALGHVTQEEFNAAVADGRAVRAFDNLKDLYDAGKISLEEYNEILEAGTWLRERSVGGVQDEQAEIAKLLPDLAEYVKQHDDQSRSLEDLDPKQRARIAALQGENAQMILQTALLVKFLEFTGQITPEAGTQLLLDLTQFDPAMQAVLEDYGFLDDPVTTPVDADTSAFDEKMKTAREEGNQPVTVPVAFSGNPESRKRGGSDGPIESIPAIVTPPADTTETEASFDTLTTEAGKKGTAAGQAWTGGLETGADGAPEAAGDAAAATIAAFDAYQQSVYNSGFNFGWNWDLGVLTGLQAMAPVIFDQARIIAQGVEDITRAQIDAHSPSNKAIELYGEWNAGAVVALRDTRAIEDAARRGAERLEWAARRGLGSRPRHLFGGDANPTAAGGAAQPIIVQQGHTRGDLVIAPVFQGVTDTREITQYVRTELVDGLDRWEASAP